ncbi:MAG TPA: hypothetical protein VGQ52_21500 [Gemmatimonadaceae bacterium]|nr:hypothetical protein [Gemmatimonadaceae bacterium]
MPYGTSVALSKDVLFLESAMVPRLFEILFVLALAAPPLAVVFGIAVLFVPAQTRQASKPESQMAAAA